MSYRVMLLVYFLKWELDKQKVFVIGTPNVEEELRPTDSTSLQVVPLFHCSEEHCSGWVWDVPRNLNPETFIL